MERIVKISSTTVDCNDRPVLAMKSPFSHPHSSPAGHLSPTLTETRHNCVDKEIHKSRHSINLTFPET